MTSFQNSCNISKQPSLSRVAVVAFLRNFQCDGITKHMECQSNRHKLHLLSESVGQPLYAFVYPSRVLPDTSRIAAGIIKYSNAGYLCQFLYHVSKGCETLDIEPFTLVSVILKVHIDHHDYHKNHQLHNEQYQNEVQ